MPFFLVSGKLVDGEGPLPDYVPDSDVRHLVIRPVRFSDVGAPTFIIETEVAPRSFIAEVESDDPAVVTALRWFAEHDEDRPMWIEV